MALAEIPGAEQGHDRAAWRRLQTQAGRWLACEAAARLTGARPEDFEITGGGNAPPRVAGFPCGTEALVIAITHSGAWVGAAAAIGLGGIGIDVQQVSLRPVERLAGFMHWTTLLASADGSALTDPDAFTHLWTLWEASVKCDGAALLARSTPAFGNLSALCVPGIAGSYAAGGYRAASSRVAPGYWLSIVTRNCTPDIQTLAIHRLQFEPSALRRF